MMNDLNPGRFVLFSETYTAALAAVVVQFPDEYPWAHAPLVIRGNTGTTTLPLTPVETVANRMLNAVASGTFNKDGRAFPRTCKQLGIKHTYAGIRAYLTGQ